VFFCKSEYPAPIAARAVCDFSPSTYNNTWFLKVFFLALSSTPKIVGAAINNITAKIAAEKIEKMIQKKEASAVLKLSPCSIRALQNVCVI